MHFFTNEVNIKQLERCFLKMEHMRKIPRNAIHQEHPELAYRGRLDVIGYLAGLYQNCYTINLSMIP